MDDLTPDRSSSVRFGPDRRLTLAVAAGAVVVALVCLLTTDLGGRLLWGAAAVVLAGYAIGDLVWNPRLVADASGVRIRTPFARCDLPWADVAEVRADVRSRYGLRASALEVDADATLVVFSRRSLGADPETVAGLVRAVRPRAGE